MKAVLYNFAYALALLAGLMCASGLTAALLFGSQEGVGALLIASGLWGYVAGVILIAFRGTDRRLRARDRFMLAVMIFTFLPLLGAVPMAMMVESANLADAYFEAVSAMTTTGWSTFPAEERLPAALLLWREFTGKRPRPRSKQTRAADLCEPAQSKCTRACPKSPFYAEV